MRSNLSVGGYSYALRCNSFDVREFPLHSSGSNRVAGFEVCFAHSMPPRIDDALVQRGEEADGAVLLSASSGSSRRFRCAQSPSGQTPYERLLQNDQDQPVCHRPASVTQLATPGRLACR